VVGGGSAAALFFHGLGLLPFVDHAGNQPLPVEALVVVAFQGESGTGGNVSPVAGAGGGCLPTRQAHWCFRSLRRFSRLNAS
jgi:hypothetical protein